jgi:hypothetical protein
VTFIDDYSKKRWILFMNNKDEVFSQFQEFRVQLENSTWKNIKVLKLDNWGEYTSSDFKTFYKKERIKREITVLYNPKNNGFVVRNNLFIIGSARYMIHA